jgi:NAD(P)-dependent dehydrogenase (short-subunit alcohol dehydrogenase family)
MAAASRPATYLVTGSTDGIGRFTALQLARDGHRVLVHGRDAAKVERVVGEARAAGAALAAGFVADLSALAEVRRLATEVTALTDGVLDGLLNNAGTFDGDYSGSRRESVDGNEYSLAVNVAAPFLLASLLLPALRRAPHARVLFTSSISQGSAAVLADPQLARRYDAHTAYAFSKLANAMLALEMAARYGRPPQLTVNCMVPSLARSQRGGRDAHTAAPGSLALRARRRARGARRRRPRPARSQDPGTVDTKMLRAGWWLGGPAVETATASHWLLTSPTLRGTSGAYYVEHRQSRASADANDASKREQLWAYLEELTGSQWPLQR